MPDNQSTIRYLLAGFILLSLCALIAVWEVRLRRIEAGLFRLAAAELVGRSWHSCASRKSFCSSLSRLQTRKSEATCSLVIVRNQPSGDRVFPEQN
jgi:hypothetical protein